MTNFSGSIDVERIDESIQMLKTYVDDPSIDPVFSLLDALKNDPQDSTLVAQLAETLNGIGTVQGAVLNYAPYIAILVSDNPFGED